MKVGGAVIFQNPHNVRSDRDVYTEDLHIGDLYEPLGFDSIWSVEHHFDDYTMCPAVLHFLPYFAGRTKTIQLGSMVVVMPWHDPMRVAEQVSVVDHMSNGRMILGLGRGLARIEFEGFRVPLGESRERFIESSEMLLEGLEKGYCEYDGKYIKQPRRDIRPKPFKSFKGRTYAAAVSPESSEIMAKLGVGLLIIPQKPWEAVTEELNAYKRIFREVNGADAPPPINAAWVICDKNADRAREMAYKYIGAYWHSVVRHYDLKGTHLLNMRGYESYKRMQEMVNAPGGVDAMVEFFLSLQVWGTPEQCYNKIVEVATKTGGEAFTGVFSYGGMPWDYAQENLKTFAKEVMPELKKRIPLQDQVIARAGVGPASKHEEFRLHS